MRTENWFEINYDSSGTYSTVSRIKFKTSMLKSSLYDYSDTHILLSGTISVTNTAAQGADANIIKKR